MNIILYVTGCLMLSCLIRHGYQYVKQEGVIKFIKNMYQGWVDIGWDLLGMISIPVFLLCLLAKLAKVYSL